MEGEVLGSTCSVGLILSLLLVSSIADLNGITVRVKGSHGMRWLLVGNKTTSVEMA